MLKQKVSVNCFSKFIRNLFRKFFLQKKKEHFIFLLCRLYINIFNFCFIILEKTNFYFIKSRQCQFAFNVLSVQNFLMRKPFWKWIQCFKTIIITKQWYIYFTKILLLHHCYRWKGCWTNVHGLLDSCRNTSSHSAVVNSV